VSRHDTGIWEARECVGCGKIRLYSHISEMHFSASQKSLGYFWKWLQPTSWQRRSEEVALNPLRGAIYAKGLKELKKARPYKSPMFMRFSCVLLKTW